MARSDAEEQMRARLSLHCAGGVLKTLLLGLATVLAVASGGGRAAPAPAAAAPAAATVPAAYRIVHLDEFNAATQPEINNRNQVAFSVPNAAGTSARAKFYDGHTVHDIGTLGGTLSLAFAVNDHGQVAGASTVPDGILHAFLWSRTSGIVDIGPSGPGAGESAANDLNNRGQVVGYAVRNGTVFAFLWSRKTGLLDIGTPVAAPEARVINESGQVALNTGYLWSRAGGYVSLDGLFPTAINERGEVAGAAIGSSGFLAPAVWTPRDGLRIFGEGGFNSQAYDINDRGLLVAFDTTTNEGFAWSRETGVLDIGTGVIPFRVNNRGQAVGTAGGHAIIWTRGTGVVDLNTRIPDAPPGLTLTVAHDISDSGAIVASSTSGLVLLLPHRGTNVAPVVGAIQAGGPAVVNRLLTFSAAFRDADAGDTHKATWHWGDGQVDTGIVSESHGAGSVSGQHAYRAAGIYTVRLTVTDSNGKSTTVQRTVVVCAHASASVGAGMFLSPPGALKAAPARGDAGLVASFAFLSDGGGANGQAAVRFTVGNLDFRSSRAGTPAADGARVRYQGMGTVNGRAGYRFTLTASAAARVGADKDRVHVRIWHSDPATHADVVDYDNGSGTAEGSELAEGAIKAAST
jgi:probable HAF family extracellular repeat protein